MDEIDMQQAPYERKFEERLKALPTRASKTHSSLLWDAPQAVLDAHQDVKDAETLLDSLTVDKTSRETINESTTRIMRAKDIYFKRIDRYHDLYTKLVTNRPKEVKEVKNADGKTNVEA